MGVDKVVLDKLGLARWGLTRCTWTCARDQPDHRPQPLLLADQLPETQGSCFAFSTINKVHVEKVKIGELSSLIFSTFNKTHVEKVKIGE